MKVVAMVDGSSILEVFGSFHFAWLRFFPPSAIAVA
jgi:hypothetical protein